jgi:hypothetical protein
MFCVSTDAVATIYKINHKYQVESEPIKEGSEENIIKPDIVETP